VQNWIGAQVDFWAQRRLVIANFQWLILSFLAQLISNMLSCPEISHTDFDGFSPNQVHGGLLPLMGSNLNGAGSAMIRQLMM